MSLFLLDIVIYIVKEIVVYNINSNICIIGEGERVKKKLLVVGINYYPEETGCGLYTTEMSEFLNDNGFDVSILTGFPYYPEWEIYQKYKEYENEYIEEINGITVYRVKQYVPKKINALNRLIHLIDYSIKAEKFIKKYPSDFDYVMVIAPTLFSSRIAMQLVKRNKKIKSWLHIQDFESDAALESGLLSKIPLIKPYIKKWECNLFSKFNVISTISNGMLKKLTEKNVKEEKKFFFPNWVDISHLTNLEVSSYRDELKLNDKFVILYSGSIANKQCWGNVIDTIEELQHNEDVCFVIAGDGSNRDYVHRQIQEKSLMNVITLPLQPKSKLNDFLNLADLHIIPQKKDVKDSVMPSKLLGILATERAVLVLANDESDIYKSIKDNNLGYVLNQNEYKDFGKKILEIKSNLVQMKDYGLNGRNFVEEKYSKEKVLHNLINKIKSL